MNVLRLTLLRETLCCLVLMSAPVLAQDRGTIEGIVSDVTAGTIPGATVTAKNAGTGLSRRALRATMVVIQSRTYLPASM